MAWKKNIKIALFCLAFFQAGIILPNIAFAQKSLDKAAIDKLDKVVPKTGVATTDIGVLAGQLIKGALGLVGLIFFGLMVYAGFLWMTDRGNEEQAEQAKKMVTAAIIGLTVVVAAYAITAFVTNRLLIGK